MKRPPILACVLFAGCMQTAQPPAAPATARPEPLPGTKLSIEQLKEQMFHVSAGKRLKGAWPNGARIAVGLSFDVDNATATLSTGTLDYEILSRGEYGAIDGLPRLLRMLDRQQVPASFFIPAASAVLHPQVIKDIQGASLPHEIGVHGWIHENLPELDDAAEEERLLTKAIDYLTRASGKRPVGYRAPAWAFSQHTLGLIRKAGFLYDSSMMAMDEPYEIVSNGQATGLIELPVDWILDDAPYFGRTGALPSPEMIFRVYRDEFDLAYEERTMFMLTMHPHVIGHRSRMKHLDELIAYMKSKPGVWFATAEQIATYVKQQQSKG